MPSYRLGLRLFLIIYKHGSDYSRTEPDRVKRVEYQYEYNDEILIDYCKKNVESWTGFVDLIHCNGTHLLTPRGVEKLRS